jgi:hypothetical protein
MKNHQSAAAGARLYVAAAEIMDTLYADLARDNQSTDPTLIAERKRQHKHFWMRLTRGDARFAHAAAAKLREKNSGAPFAAHTQRMLDQEIISRLAARIDGGALMPAAIAPDAAKGLLARVSALLDECNMASATESLAA